VKKVSQALLDLAVILVYLVKLVSPDKQEIVVVLVILGNPATLEELVKMDYQETKVIVVSLVCLACAYLIKEMVHHLDKQDQLDLKENAVHLAYPAFLAQGDYLALKVQKVIVVLMVYPAALVNLDVMVLKEEEEIADDLVILVQLDFLVHKGIVVRKVNQVQKVNLVVQFLVKVVLMVIQANLVFQEQRVNAVYLVFLVYLAIHRLLVVYPAHKDLLVHRVAQVPLVFKVLLV
jgi:hypothetical protein